MLGGSEAQQRGAQKRSAFEIEGVRRLAVRQAPQGEGRELVVFCATELEAVGQGLEELRLDELVERLERGAQ